MLVVVVVVVVTGPVRRAEKRTLLGGGLGLSLTEVMTAADLDESQQQSLMAEINMMSNIYAFALPGLDEELSVTCNFLMHVSFI